MINFDKGIFYTIKELLIRPGENIPKFIHNDRNRLVKPLIFVIVCSLIYTIFGIIESITKVKILQVGGFIYISLKIGQFFDENKKIELFERIC